MRFYSAVKKNELMSSAATWMDQEITMPSEISQTEKVKYHMVSLTCGVQQQQQNDTNELIYKTNRLTDPEIKLRVTKGESGGKW